MCGEEFSNSGCCEECEAVVVAWDIQLPGVREASEVLDASLKPLDLVANPDEIPDMYENIPGRDLPLGLEVMVVVVRDEGQFQALSIQRNHFAQASLGANAEPL